MMIHDRKIIILMYHMISELGHSEQKRYAVSKKRFRHQMRYLKQMGYTPISLNDLYNYRNSCSALPERPVIITFDDGYMDNYEHAYPVLREYDFPAMFFVVSDFVGKTNQWMVGKGKPKRTLMGWHHIGEMADSGIIIGSHTVSHPRLSMLKPDDSIREIKDSKKQIEDKLGMHVNHFAYPYGDMNKSIVNMVKEAGYKTACTTMSGFNYRDINLYELRRIDIYGTDSLWQFAIKLTYGTNDGDLFLPVRYYMKRFFERVR